MFQKMVNLLIQLFKCRERICNTFLQIALNCHFKFEVYKYLNNRCSEA